MPIGSHFDVARGLINHPLSVESADVVDDKLRTGRGVGSHNEVALAVLSEGGYPWASVHLQHCITVTGGRVAERLSEAQRCCGYGPFPSAFDLQVAGTVPMPGTTTETPPG